MTAVLHILAFVLYLLVPHGLADEAMLPIEQLEPGMRVRTAVAGEAQVASTAINAESWRLVTMQIPNEYGGGGGFVEIRRLMEVAELEALSAEVGGYIYLYIDELQIRGNAKVLSLEDCPAIEPGDGRVVVATYTHVNAHIQHLTLESSESILEPTAGHPFWAVDLQDYIPAADLAPGDRLLLADATEAVVATNTRQPGQQRVYNIEVEGDHRYFAGDDAVLVHNSYALLRRAVKYLDWKGIDGAGRRALFQRKGVVRAKSNVPLATLKSVRRHSEHLVAGKRSSFGAAISYSATHAARHAANGNYTLAGTYFHSLNKRILKSRTIAGIELNPRIYTPVGSKAFRVPDLKIGGRYFDYKPRYHSQFAYNSSQQFRDIFQVTGITPIPLYYRIE